MGNKMLVEGQVFNNLTVIKYTRICNKRRMYFLKCGCGKVIEAFGKYVKNGDKKSCGCIKNIRHIKDLTGKIYSRLTVLKMDESTRNKSGCLGKTKWLCKCECGKIVSVLSNSLRTMRTTSCGCAHKDILEASRKFYEEIPIQYLTSVEGNAKSRKIVFDIDYKDIWDKFLEQDGKCFYSGIKIGFRDEKRNGKVYNSASIDRIDSRIGYVKENICLVHKKINLMKNTLSLEEFLYFCKQVAENHK